MGPRVSVTSPSMVVVSASANCGIEIKKAHRAADLTAFLVAFLRLSEPLVPTDLEVKVALIA